MKYTVMECHDGYAVLIGEDSRFVRAANLHYTVGQVVTAPVILAEDEKQPAISRTVFMKIAAVAACLMLVSAVGLTYYRRNLKTRSVLTIGSDFNIQLELNSKGKVIRIESETAGGKDVLEHYEKKDKDMVVAVNDILGVMKEQGYITNEDTVDVYISADSKKASASYKDEIEHEISAQKVNVSVLDKNEKKPPSPPKPTEDKKESDRKDSYKNESDKKESDKKGTDKKETDKKEPELPYKHEETKKPATVPVPSEPVLPDEDKIVDENPPEPPVIEDKEDGMKPDKEHTEVNPEEKPPLPSEKPSVPSDEQKLPHEYEEFRHEHMEFSQIPHQGHKKYT